MPNYFFVESNVVKLNMVNITVSRDEFLKMHEHSKNYEIIKKYPSEVFLDIVIKTSINEDVEQWLLQNEIYDYELREYPSSIISIVTKYRGIYFKNKEDALKFKLRWN